MQLESHEVTFSIWDIGGHTSSETMLPLCATTPPPCSLCLTRAETPINWWWHAARALNKCAMPLLIGCKYDLLLDLPSEEHAHRQPLPPLCSRHQRAAHLLRALRANQRHQRLQGDPHPSFGLAPAVPILRQPGEPWIIYERVPGEARSMPSRPMGGRDGRGTAAPNGSVSQGSPRRRHPLVRHLQRPVGR